MFRNLLRPDSALMITMSQITDCIFLSMFWFVCCVPIVTIGAATAALYDSVYHAFRKGSKHSWQRYWQSFRSNLRSSLISSILFAGVLCLLIWGTIQLWNNSVYGNISWGVFAAGAFAVFLLVGILSILFPMQSRFENSTTQLWNNTFRIGFANLPLTLLLAAVNCASFFLCMRFVFPLFFLPALACLIDTLFIEPMFKPYMPSEDAA